MPIRITVEVDESRLAEAGIAATEDDVLAELQAMAERDGRLSLQSRNRWLPVRNLKVRRNLVSSDQVAGHLLSERAACERDGQAAGQLLGRRQGDAGRESPVSSRAALASASEGKPP
jgi:hypothetical protein